MTKFFKAPTPQMVSLREQLLQVWNDDNQNIQVRTQFSVDDPEHIGLIRNCTSLARDTLVRLQAIDVQIVGAFALGLAAFVASWVFPLTYLAIIGFSYAAYQTAKRQQLYADYNYVLENLETCCAWSLGQSQSDSTNVLTCPEIQEMLALLCSVMSKSQFQRLIAGDLQDAAFASGEQGLMEEIARNPLLPEATAEQQRDLLYRLYGRAQGSAISIVQCIAFIIRNAWRSITSSPVRDDAQENVVLTV